MNAETQILVERVETLERQARSWKLLGVFAVLLAGVAVVMPFLGLTSAPAPPSPARGGRALFSTVEANRFLLRDIDGRLAGGLEAGRDSTIKLVLGGRQGNRSAAFLEVHPNGIVALTMRGPDGGVRAALLATDVPSLSLSPNGLRSSVTLTTTSDGSGMIQLRDPAGRLRFKAP